MSGKPSIFLSAFLLLIVWFSPAISQETARDSSKAQSDNFITIQGDSAVIVRPDSAVTVLKDGSIQRSRCLDCI